MAAPPRRPFHLASDDEIKAGKVSDVYFTRSVEILRKRGISTRAKAEVRTKSLPADWGWGVLAGIEEVARLLEGIPIDVIAMDEGMLFRPFEPVLALDGIYTEWAEYETAILVLLC